MGELKGRARADTVERRFDRRFRRNVPLDDRDDLLVKTRQTTRECDPFGEPDLTARDELGLVDGTGDDGPSGAARSRVDAQDPANVRQDAASETASASNDKFANTF